MELVYGMKLARSETEMLKVCRYKQPHLCSFQQIGVFRDLEADFRREISVRFGSVLEESLFRNLVGPK